MHDVLRSSGLRPKGHGSGSMYEAWRDLSHFVTNSRSIEDAGDNTGPPAGHGDRGQGRPRKGG